MSDTFIIGQQDPREGAMYGITIAAFGWFVYSSAGFGTYLYQATPAVNLLTEFVLSHTLPSQVLCAMECHKSVSSCEGFAFNVVTDRCTLYNTVCWLDKETKITTVNNSIFVRNKQACELHTTLALGKPASMSSELHSSHATSYPAYASKGNDGLKPASSAGEVYYRFSTIYEQNPWWRCDITHVCIVTSVYFMNRGWSAADWMRTRNIMVTVSVLEADIMYNGADNMCGFIAVIAQQFDNLVNCSQPMIGRFVQLQMFSTDNFALYEVEVYGYARNP